MSEDDKVIPWFSRDARDLLREEVGGSLEDAEFFQGLRGELENFSLRPNGGVSTLQGNGSNPVMESYRDYMDLDEFEGYRGRLETIRDEKGFSTLAGADMYDEFTTLPLEEQQVVAVVKNIENGSPAPAALQGFSQMLDYASASRKAMSQDFRTEARRVNDYIRDFEDLVAEVEEIDGDGGPWSFDETIEVVERLESVKEEAGELMQERADEIRETSEVSVPYRELTDPVYFDRPYDNPVLADAAELVEAVELRMDSIVPVEGY